MICATLALTYTSQQSEHWHNYAPFLKLKMCKPPSLTFPCMNFSLHEGGVHILCPPPSWVRPTLSNKGHDTALILHFTLARIWWIHNSMLDIVKSLPCSDKLEDRRGSLPTVNILGCFFATRWQSMYAYSLICWAFVDIPSERNSLIIEISYGVLLP